MRRLSLLAPLAAALCAAFSAAASAAPVATPIAPVASDTPISAYGGYVVWSEKGANGLYRLVVADRDGKRVLTQVPPRSVPFDVDAGPDAAGHATATFSRCATEPDRTTQQPWSAARGCRLRAVLLPGGGERAIAVPARAGASDSTPSVWGARVAFQRRTAGSDVSQVMVYDFRTRRMTTLPHGALPHFCPYANGCAKARYSGELGELDLGARTAAYSWHVVTPAATGAGAVWELRAVATGGRRRSILAGNGYSSGACGARVPYSPNATAGGVTFLARWYHCESVEGTLTRTTFVSGGLLDRTDDVGGTVAWRMAVDAASNTTYVVLGPYRVDTQTGLPSGGGLTLARVTGLAYAPTRKRAGEPFMTRG